MMISWDNDNLRLGKFLLWISAIEFPWDYKLRSVWMINWEDYSCGKGSVQVSRTYATLARVLFKLILYDTVVLQKDWVKGIPKLTLRLQGLSANPFQKPIKNDEYKSGWPHRFGLVYFLCFLKCLEQLKPMPKSLKPMFFWSVQNELYQYLRRPTS